MKGWSELKIEYELGVKNTKPAVEWTENQLKLVKFNSRGFSTKHASVTKKQYELIQLKCEDNQNTRIEKELKKFVAFIEITKSKRKICSSRRKKLVVRRALSPFIINSIIKRRLAKRAWANKIKTDIGKKS